MGEVKSCGMEQINKELFLSHKKKADEGSKKYLKNKWKNFLMYRKFSY